MGDASGAEERIAELEVELASARRTIDVLIDRVERDDGQIDFDTLRDVLGADRAGERPEGARAAELFATAASLTRVIEEREREVAEARAELAAARSEFRALTANLDQIVRQRTRALAESEAQLRAKNRELERQGSTKAEFISIVAHELRTPLTSIVGYLDLFSEGRFGALPAPLVRPVGSLRRNAHRLKRLVDDMLDVSRIEDGRMVLRYAEVHLGELVHDVVTELLPLASARRQRLDERLGAVPPIEVDADKVHQIAVNLLSNAIRYTPDGGLISVDLDEAPPERFPGGWARLRVRDNGIGIPEEHRHRIFEPFVHAAPAKHHTSSGPDSAGLGLYIAHGLTELHGGLITVDSQPGEFTEFTVLLPLRRPRDE